MKNARTAALALAAGVAVITYFSFYNDATQKEIIIEITDEEFAPEKIAIASNTKVTWINTGTFPHWPASNFHPTHTLYPEEGGCIGSLLDSCRGLNQGEKYSFVFKKIGVWNMHDHLYPGLTMTVIVGEKQGSADKPLSLNVEENEIKKMSAANPQKAWEYLKEKFIQNGEVIGNAHELAHIVGNSIYDKHGLKGVKLCDEAFAFGCFHGVTEKMLFDLGRDAVTKAEAECLKILPKTKSQNYTGCIHGMGHGLLTWRNFDAEKALKDCDLLSHENRNYCYDGVFMERSLSAPEAYKNSEAYWTFCGSLGEKYQYNCARYQSQIFLNNFKNSIKESAEKCAEAPKPLLANTCLESIGYHAAQKAKGALEETKKLCGEIQNKNAQSFCILGASREVEFQKYSGWEETKKELNKIYDNYSN